MIFSRGYRHLLADEGDGGGGGKGGGGLGVDELGRGQKDEDEGGGDDGGHPKALAAVCPLGFCVFPRGWRWRRE